MESSATRDNDFILVTGAAGFIGRACVEEFLGRGYRVAALVHRNEHPYLQGAERDGNLLILRASITDEAGLRRTIEGCLNSSGSRIRAVVHCAAHASDVGPRRLFREVNYNGVRNLVSCMADLPVERLVFLSTTDVYGLRDLHGADEETPFCNNLRNPYPEFKFLAEEYVRETLSPERWVILRPAAVWGPGDTTILPRIVDFYRRSPWIVHFGKWRGKNRWPAVYVTNVARAARLAAVHLDAGGKTYNVVDDHVMTIEEYYRIILETCLPERIRMRSVTLPFAAGWIAGLFSTMLSNALRRRHPLFDPTLYGLYSVSKNLDIRGDRVREFVHSHGESFVDPETARKEFRNRP